MKTEKAMIGAICGVKLIDKRSSQELMNLLVWEETLDLLSRANGVQRYAYVLM